MAVCTEDRQISYTRGFLCWQLSERDRMVTFGKSTTKLTIDRLEVKGAHLAVQPPSGSEDRSFLPTDEHTIPLPSFVQPSQHLSFRELLVLVVRNLTTTFLVPDKNGVSRSPELLRHPSEGAPHVLLQAIAPTEARARILGINGQIIEGCA